jgi:hypothetical protein
MRGSRRGSEDPDSGDQRWQQGRPSEGAVSHLGNMRRTDHATRMERLVAAILIRSGWTLVRDSGLVLLEGVPMHLDRNEAARDLERAVPDLQQVHPMWLGRTTASQPALAAVNERLRADHGIDRATVEVERSAERAG